MTFYVAEVPQALDKGIDLRDPRAPSQVADAPDLARLLRLGSERGRGGAILSIRRIRGDPSLPLLRCRFGRRDEDRRERASGGVNLSSRTMAWLFDLPRDFRSDNDATVPHRPRLERSADDEPKGRRGARGPRG